MFPFICFFVILLYVFFFMNMFRKFWLRGVNNMFLLGEHVLSCFG
jgi:hypothetical protein